ncbi:Methyltransferase domain-containing protein [Ekhidna lutea]|uniref:Methyltransferase domain-containing protein n=1 Tax=Ekhidna lutea TaxID=447679 RepID=A0A239FDV7_EKHLU|nr:class I SAM-dependent methyltransferase [Ekhidna lutea]SNS54254.1 Methyltransferase domain-containing protein [Ekhidna lutea]
MAVNDFDFIAPFYDRLSKLVFGESLIQAQAYHLKEIGDKDHVLILGGGTGKLLEYIPKSGELDFVEKSVRMLDRAKRRKFHGSINFIQSDFLEFESDKRYDVIICPFFLDCFDQQSLNTVIAKIKRLLSTNAKLIVVDFEKRKVNTLLLDSMLIFFRWCANLETIKLLDLRSFLKKNNFQENEIKFYHKGVFSALYYQVGKRKR